MPKISTSAHLKLKPASKKEIQINVELGKIITEKLEDLEKRLGCSHEELALWHLQHQHVAMLTMLLLLRSALTYELDPTLSQIIFIEVDGKYKTYITTNGWIEIIHRQAQFDGVHFEYSPIEIGGIPSWIECTIWRKDYKQPIGVREYYQDAKSSNLVDKELPIRILRHRALSACARLAFGITTPGLYGSVASPLGENADGEFPRCTSENHTKSKPKFNCADPLHRAHKGPDTRSALLKQKLLISMADTLPSPPAQQEGSTSI
jgi:hypothetical protein